MPSAPLQIACLGGLNLDSVARTLRPPDPGASNPAAIASRPGGVAFNVARRLAAAGAAVALAGAVGRDAEGDALLAAAAAAGIATDAVLRSATLPTGRYLAIEDDDGRLIVAAADMRATDALTAEDAARMIERLPETALWFADANLPAPALAAVAAGAAARGVPLAVNAVSLAKAARLRPVFGRLAYLFCNRAEAAALLNGAYPDPAPRLRALTGAAVVVTDGPRPVAVADAEGVHEIAVPVADTRNRLTTGAGDALAAGTLAALAQGQALAEAVAQGVDWARAAIETAAEPERSAP